MTVFKGEKADKFIRIYAAALLGLCMILVALTGTVMSLKPAVQFIAAPLCWLFMLLCFFRGGYGKRSVYLLGLILLAWFVVSRFFQDKGFTDQSMSFFAEMSMIYGLVFPAARVLGLRTMRKFFGAAAALMLLVLTVSAWLGVYCVVSGTDLSFFNGNFTFYVAEYNQRLYAMGLNSNVAGALFAIGIVLDAYLTARFRKPLMLIPAVFSLVGQFWALSLTDSRGAEISLMAACIPGILLFMGRILKKENRLRIALMLVAALAGLFLTYESFGFTHSFLSGWRVSVMESAKTEEPAIPAGETAPEKTEEPAISTGETVPEKTESAEALIERDMLTDGLNGRERVYRCTLNYLRDHPLVLLTGASESKISMMSFYQVDHRYMKLHVHNSFLQTLALLGGFGLLLVLGICLALLVYSLRILLSRERFPEEKLLPLFLLLLIVNVMVESYLFVPYTFLADSAFINLFFFLTAGYAAELGRERNKPDEPAGGEESHGTDTISI